MASNDDSTTPSPRWARILPTKVRREDRAPLGGASDETGFQRRDPALTGTVHPHGPDECARDHIFDPNLIEDSAVPAQTGRGFSFVTARATPSADSGEIKR